VKRRVVGALAGGLLALAMLPGSAAAVTPGSVDQSAAPGSSWYMFDWPISQSFTAGHSGQMNRVELHCRAAFAASVTVTVTSATSWPATCATEGWVSFIFQWPPMLTAGDQYTMDISSGGTPMEIAVAASDYAGGQAEDGSGPISGVSDFAFRTYMYTIDTTLTWSVADVPGGQSTSVTMTTVSHWPATPLEDFSGFANYGMFLDTIPSWFAPTGITCSAPIAAGDCTVANFQAGITSIPIAGAEATVTIVVTGDAAPALGDVGSYGQGRAYGQVWSNGVIGPGMGYYFGYSSWGTDDLGVVDAAAPTAPPQTPPPSGTAREPGQSGSGWLWPMLLLGLLAAAASLRTVAGRRVRQG
jgi:hypothetical protein